MHASTHTLITPNTNAQRQQLLCRCRHHKRGFHDRISSSSSSSAPLRLSYFTVSLHLPRLPAVLCSGSYASHSENTGHVSMPVIPFPLSILGTCSYSPCRPAIGSHSSYLLSTSSNCPILQDILHPPPWHARALVYPRRRQPALTS